MRKDPRVWAAIVAVAAVAFGAGAAWGARVPANARAARIAANRTLARLRLPSGATRSATDPSGWRLARPATYPATPDLVDVHSFWHVPGDPAAVYDWLEAHPPAGTKTVAGGGIATHKSIVMQYVGFSFSRPVSGGAPSETLLVNVVAARGGGTAVRADGQVVWLFKRPASERIPDGVHAIKISEVRPGGSAAGPWTVAGRARVRRIVAIVNALPAAQPGPVACPAMVGPVVTLRFASAGRRLATAYVDGGSCGFVSLWIHGRRWPALEGGPGLIRRLSSLLGISL